MNARPTLIYLVVGEPSGDAIGASLMTSLFEISNHEIEFAGLGGETMTANGFHSLFPIAELSVMGLLEVIPHARRILNRIDQVVEDIRQRRPDIVVTIDSPSFSSRVAKRIANMKIPKVHYVAPTVWAWRPWRVKKFQRYYDHLLTILPFEPPIFECAGLATTFVGHPVLEYGVANANGVGFRSRHAISNTDTLICLLPGSRRGEVIRHLQIFGETLNLLTDMQECLRSVIPTVPQVTDLVRNGTAGWKKKPIIIESPLEKYDSMAASNVALAASGTVALETALAELPTVIAYRVNPITAFLVRCLIKVDFVNIVNIMAEREVVPEYLQRDCQPEHLRDEIIRLLQDEGPKQISEAAPFIKALQSGYEKPSQIAARYLIESVLQHPSK